MNNNKLKIGFITTVDPNDKNAWSGTHYYLKKTLEMYFGEVEVFGPLNTPWLLWANACSDCSRIFRKLHGEYHHGKFMARKYSTMVQKKLCNNHYDLLISSASPQALAYVETDIPLVSFGDSSYALRSRYFGSQFPAIDVGVNEIEKLALTKSSAIILASQWAANATIDDYALPPEKVHVIPLGANLDIIPKTDNRLPKKKGEICRLLFIGKKWYPKGGDIAFECLLKLLDMGLNAELTVCGCIPPEVVVHPKLRVIPYLNKMNTEDYKQLEELFWNSDFFILPTRRECYGLVFAEASAHGLPSLATDTGGVSSVITEGVNGFLFKQDATGSEYAKKIQEIWHSDNNYELLTLSARKIFEERLCWDAWAKSFKKVLEIIL
ncbi:MAG: glycosyltransferase family 4 protein [Bacteroidetes bacterium]|nr:glycosyltransferase family 4 protein [Bacteroidota bacterium]